MNNGNGGSNGNGENPCPDGEVYVCTGPINGPCVLGFCLACGHECECVPGEDEGES